jgi:hypothetical protein
LLIALPVIAWLSFTRWRTGLSALGTLGILVVLSTVVLDSLTNGWYQYYVFGELSSQGIVPENWSDFWRYDLFHPLAPLVFLILAGSLVLVGARRWWTLDWSAAGFFLAVGAGLLAASWAGRLHLGGYNDVLMPAYAALALGGGLVAGMLRRHPRVLARIALSAALIGFAWVQFARISYPVQRQIPSALDREDGRHFLDLIRHLPGEVIVFDHPYYSTLAGKGSFVDEEAADDVERSGPSLARRILVADMHRALLNPAVGAVILDDPGDEQNLQRELKTDYHLLPAPAIPGKGFFPVTDLPLRPALVFVRNKESK